MSETGDDLRRFADVVDALQEETPISVDGAQLLSGGDDAVRGQLTVTVPADADLHQITAVSDQSEDTEQTETTDDTERDDLEADDLLDHTSTEDLQQAYDEADGNISAASDRFEVGYGAVYRRMTDHGVHETESNEDDSDESGTSTEDDTPTSESKSEAPTVDLEEDAADDAPEDTGDDVQHDHTAEPITVDAVDDQAETNVEFSEGVTRDDVEAAVDEHETLGDVAEALGVTRGRARTFTSYLGCYGDVRDLPRGGR
ncbi:hypothetical protein C482_15533 [Natrialba chahannaoensis JCM 10990]|uniref:Uncharacterized protein n=1 Tax=Natrialba chahannaoensis JCM 10990 TaxID=1227492 RepID=M0ADT5_9EURY|nr:hypothetical protein [Natrialba chahannaoensis]ELY96551.1 hypothetical protein C482_15533 [Natrialba chahannaoensis JCM 10990]